MSLNPSILYFSERYGYYKNDENGNPLMKKFDSVIPMNINFNYQDIFGKDTNVSIGVYNIFDTEHNFIQPYNSGHAPLPGPSREFVFKLSYKF
ncbi:MAG: hypothetical protein ABII90_02930 [Bacteroidota bacterium]